MNFNSANEASRFLSNSGLGGICPEAQNLIACMNVLSRMCSCDPPQAKRAKFNECNHHYIAFVGRAQSFSNVLLQKANDNKMNFFFNNQLIGSISR